MTFAVGRRFVIADGVERWKDSEVEPVVEALEDDRRRDADGRLLRARGGPLQDARRARQGGHGRPAASSQTEARSRAASCRAGCRPGRKELGLELDHEAARALIARVGERQQRLLRELEKIALELGPGAEPTAEEIDELVAPARPSARRGRSPTPSSPGTAGRAMRALRRAARPGRARRRPAVRDRPPRARRARRSPSRWRPGESPAQIKGRLRMPPYAADRLIADVRRHDAETFRRALELLADLELETRGGGGAALERGHGRRARHATEVDDVRRAAPLARRSSPLGRLRQRGRAHRRRRRSRRAEGGGVRDGAAARRRGRSSSSPRRARPPRPRSTRCPPTPAPRPPTTRACPSRPARASDTKQRRGRRPQRQEPQRRQGDRARRTASPCRRSRRPRRSSTSSAPATSSPAPRTSGAAATAASRTTATTAAARSPTRSTTRA